MHATHFFIDWLVVRHARGTLDSESTLFKLIVKFFLNGVVFMFCHDSVFIELLKPRNKQMCSKIGLIKRGSGFVSFYYRILRTIKGNLNPFFSS